MQALVAEGRLQRADVLLTRTRDSLLGALIRFGTQSYWSHALMVYVVRNPEEGYDATFIIESGGAGIDVHNIAHYLEKPGRYDVGVKRLDTAWLKNGNNAGGLRYRRKIRGYALQEIDAKYDHGLIISIATRILRQLILVALFPCQRFRNEKKRRVLVPRVAGIKVNAYICSGFVQWAYYQALSKIIKEDNLNNDIIDEVIFNPRALGKDLEGDLLSTTPADLADSDKLAWKYVVKDGRVYEVSGQAEVDKLTGRK